MCMAMQLVTTVTVCPHLMLGSARQLVSRAVRRTETEERFEYYYRLALTRLLYHLLPLAGSYQAHGLHPKITAVLDTAAGLGVETTRPTPPGERPALRDVVRTMMQADHRTFDIQSAVEWAAVGGLNPTGEAPIADRLDALTEITYEVMYADLDSPWAVHGTLDDEEEPT